MLTASRRKLVPTARALEIRQPLRALLADLDLLVRETAQFDPATTDRTFRHKGTDHARAVLSAAPLQPFAEQAPNAHVAFLPFDPPAFWAQLEQDETDLALVTGMNPPEARRRPGLVEAFKVIERKGHPRGDGPLSLDRFRAAEHVLISPEGGGFFGAADKILADMGRARRIACSVPNFLGRDPPQRSGLAIHPVQRAKRPLHPPQSRCILRPQMYGGGCQAVYWKGRRCLRQRNVQELFRRPRMRIAGPAEVPHPGRSTDGDLRVHRRLVQSSPSHSALEYLAPIGHKTERPRDAKAL